MKFKYIRRPFYDEKGNIVDITGRYNRPGIDEFMGGGKVYPEIISQKDKIIERYQDDTFVYIKLDITESEAEKIRTKQKALKYQASPKVMIDYNHKDFKAERLTDEEADKMKQDVFGIISVESGVTN